MRSSSAVVMVLSSNTNNNVFQFDTGRLGSGARRDRRNDGAAACREPERRRLIALDRVDLHTEQAAADFAELQQLAHDRLGDFGWNRKTDADVAAASRQDRRVNANEFAAQVDERAARVARVDRCIGLNKVFVRVGAADTGAALRTDDAGRYRVRKAERVTDGNNEIAYLGLVRIAERDLRQLIRRHFQDRDIGAGVGANDLGIEHAIVEQRYFDGVCVLDDMMVGHNVAVARIDNDARALALHGFRSRGVSGIPKKRRLNGSSANGERCETVDLTRILTTAGATSLMSGASDGTGWPSTTSGRAACA